MQEPLNTRTVECKQVLVCVCCLPYFASIREEWSELRADLHFDDITFWGSEVVVRKRGRIFVADTKVSRNLHASQPASQPYQRSRNCKIQPREKLNGSKVMHLGKGKCRSYSMNAISGEF
jgi:hypothetical protein